VNVTHGPPCQTRVIQTIKGEATRGPDDTRQGDHARPGLPCAGTGAKALQRYHCGVKRSLMWLAGLLDAISWECRKG
jgi:hypothetical protein